MIELKDKSVGYLYSLERKGGVGSGIRGHVTEREESPLHEKNPAENKIIALKEDKEKVWVALKYLSKNSMNKDCTIEVVKLGNRYGNSSGNKIYVDSVSVKSLHPIFIAAIIFHENIHSTQDSKKMNSERREFDARFRTNMWASLKIGKLGVDASEKQALEKVIKESVTNRR